MQIQVREHVVHVHIISVTGRLEAFTVGSLRQQQDSLLDDGARNFIVDLSETTFMDSAGMAALVSLLKGARSAHGEVALVRPQEPAAYRILALTRFDQVFKMADTVDEALRLF
jgi:anti-anti-sigma factor